MICTTHVSIKCHFLAVILYRVTRVLKETESRLAGIFGLAGIAGAKYFLSTDFYSAVRDCIQFSRVFLQRKIPE